MAWEENPSCASQDIRTLGSLLITPVVVFLLSAPVLVLREEIPRRELLGESPCPVGKAQDLVGKPGPHS